MRAKSIYLKSRLSDLLYAEGAMPIPPEQVSYEEFAKKVTDSRNYFTHYDPLKKDHVFTQDDLLTVNVELMILLEYHLMALIGFDSKFATQRARRRLKSLVGDVTQTRLRMY